MPVFEITAPDGRTFEVEGPDAQGALAALTKALGSVQAQPEGDRFDLGNVKNDPDLKAGLEKKAAAMRDPEPSVGLDVASTTTGGLIEGIPIIGPIIRGGVERAAAATDAAFSDRTYEQNMEFLQRDRERMKKEYPVLDTGSQIVGAIGSTLPVAATATGAKALGIVGGNLATRTGAGLASGAVITGADALVRSGGDVGEAVDGALVGGGVGAAVPVIGAGIGAGLRAAKAAASPATQAVVNRIRPQGQAADLTVKALERDGIGLDDAAQKLAAMRTTNPDAVLADVAGSNTRDLARAAVNTPGPQKEAIHSFIEARNLAQPQRITEAVKSVLKNPDDFTKTASRMAAERERIAAPIYQEAFKKGAPVNVASVLKHIDDQISPGATGLMSPIADLRPDGITATLGNLRNFFGTATNQRFDLRQLHQIKMELDGMIGTAKRGGDDTKARALLGVQTRLLQVMDKASPAYKKARGIYSNTYALEEALDTGRNILRMGPLQAKEAISGMTAAEKEMAQVGLSRAIADAVAGMRDGRDVVKALFGTKAVRDTLREAFPDPQSYRQFQLTLLRETRMRKTADAIRGNSSTAAQLNSLMDIQGGGTFGRDVMSLLLDGRPGQAAGAAVRQILKGETGLSEKVAASLSDMLLSNDPNKVRAAITTLEKRKGSLERLHRRLTATGNYGAAVTGQAAQIPYRSSLSD